MAIRDDLGGLLREDLDAFVIEEGCGSSGASTISTICNKKVDREGAIRGT
jgi:hypothetical protein